MPMTRTNSRDITDAGLGVAACGPSAVTNEEESLLVCARAGDAAAFASLVMPHRDRILRLTRRVLRNREDAEDAVQTTFLDALRHLDGFQGRFTIFFVAHSYCAERSFHEIAFGSTENRN